MNFLELLFVNDETKGTRSEGSFSGETFFEIFDKIITEKRQQRKWRQWEEDDDDNEESNEGSESGSNERNGVDGDLDELVADIKQNFRTKFNATHGTDCDGLELSAEDWVQHVNELFPDEKYGDAVEELETEIYSQSGSHNDGCYYGWQLDFVDEYGFSNGLNEWFEWMIFICNCCCVICVSWGKFENDVLCVIVGQ